MPKVVRPGGEIGGHRRLGERLPFFIGMYHSFSVEAAGAGAYAGGCVAPSRTERSIGRAGLMVDMACL